MKSIEIRLATVDDLPGIHAWALKENEEYYDNGLFYGWKSTSSRCEEGELYVVVDGDKIVAYADSGLEFLHVRKQFRKLGIGTNLAKFVMEAIRESGEFAIVLECIEPSTGFWKKMGFKEIGGKSYHTLMKYVFVKEFDLSCYETPVNVEIDFFKEEKLYNKTNSDVAVESFQPEAMIDKDLGIVYLGKSVTTVLCRDSWQRDLVLRIRVDGEEVYFDKAKRRFGKDVIRNRNAYTIETIKLLA